MIIKDIRLTNFGKFNHKMVTLEPGLNIVYGENEAGKTTLHTFIRGMLFGIEKQRGKASGKDLYTKYEPWDNPANYHGMMRIESDGVTYRIERNFNKLNKSFKVINEDKGVELKTEEIENLFAGLDESCYYNTISISQLGSVTDKELEVILKNYAANYYATGNSEIDLEGALALLKERKKELEKEEREKRQLISEKKERAEMEASYVWRDLHQLENEAEQLKRSCEEKRREWESWVNEDKKRKKREEAAGYFAGWRIHPLEAVSMLGAFFVTFLLFHKPWNFLVAIVVALAEGLYVWNCLKDGKKKKKARLQEIKEQGISLKADYERQKGKLAKVQETYHEKEVLYENLQERVGEFDEMERLKNKQGVELAMEQLTRLAAQMQSRTSDLMNTEVSAIMDAITDGKYNRLWVDENLYVQLMSNGKKISMDQVSRGTLEQIYFAIRMAATKILHEEECPVILDDTFGYYDDSRLAQTLRWLKDSKRQVIIFSCQKREMEMLEKMGCAYHKVML